MAAFRRPVVDDDPREVGGELIVDGGVSSMDAESAVLREEELPMSQSADDTFRVVLPALVTSGEERPLMTMPVVS